MSNTLKKITTEAKRLRKRSPRMSWKNAVKEAGKKYRSGKLSARPARKKATVKKRVSGIENVISGTGSVTMHKAAIKSHYKVDLANTLLRRELATTKTEKKKLSKKIADLKRSLRHFS